MVDLGDIALVWSLPRFAFGFFFGWSFGYYVVASISAQERWRTANSARAYAWLVGVLCAYFLVGMAFTQAFGALLANDEQWNRIISGIGPYLAIAFGTGVGTWRGLVRATGLGGMGIPQRVYSWWYGVQRRWRIIDDEKQAREDDKNDE